MKEQLERRLNQLRTEFDSGQKILADGELRQARLRESLLRISGAIQVLEETLAEGSGPRTGNVETLDIQRRETSRAG